MSGPVEGIEPKVTTSNVVNTHFLRVINQENDLLQRSTELKKCFENDLKPKFSEEDWSVLNDFEEKIVFENGRYHVSLPFKENVEPLGDNYPTSKRRLQNLLGKFAKDKQLLADYENIINEQRNLNIP